ncbi:MAG: DUF423 domain-containing protein [Pseudomonadales bacterium]
MSSLLLTITGISGFLAVALGAFGAHALKNRLDADMLAVYHTAVQYHFIHTLALLGAAMLAARFVQVATWSWAGWMFIVGMLIFSGSLYALALSGVRILGAITPIGGVCFLVGWAMFAVAAWQSKGL